MSTLANALCRIRNAYRARHQVVVLPASLLVFRVCTVMASRGFLDSVEWVSVSPLGLRDKLVITLKYLGPKRASSVRGIKHISKSGSRTYLTSQTLPSLLGGLGLVVVSTSSGVMSASRAKSLGIGGEVLCYVW